MTILFLPWLLVLLLVVAVGFAVRRWWKTAGILVLMALLLNWWGHVVPMNCLATQSSDAAKNRIKVLAWNIKSNPALLMEYSKKGLAFVGTHMNAMEMKASLRRDLQDIIIEHKQKYLNEK